MNLIKARLMDLTVKKLLLQRTKKGEKIYIQKNMQERVM